MSSRGYSSKFSPNSVSPIRDPDYSRDFFQHKNIEKKHSLGIVTKRLGWFVLTRGDPIRDQHYSRDFFQHKSIEKKHSLGIVTKRLGWFVLTWEPDWGPALLQIIEDCH